MKQLIIFLLLCTTTSVNFAQLYRVGSKVEIYYSQVWYPGSIIDVSGDKYKVHYDKFTSYWDEWVTKERLRPIKGDPAPAINNTAPPPVSVNKGGFKTGKLYYGLNNLLQSVYYYFMPDGKVIWGCPTGGLEYFNASASCTKDPSNCGTYSKNGNNIIVNWKNGETYTGNIKGRAIENINAANIVEVYNLQPQLSASYSSTYNSGGVSAGQTYRFMNDGSFTVQRASGFDNGDGKWSGETSNNYKGTYKIVGFTAILNYANGKVVRHTIFGIGSAQNPAYLGLDESVLNKK